MTLFDYGRCAVLVAVFALCAACGGGGDGGDEGGGGNNPPPPPPPANTGIGTAGGTVTGASGAKVVIPAGALTANVDIQVHQTSSGAPALPAGVTPAGAMFAFTPHGTTFAVPATITVPFDPALVPGGATPTLFKTNANQTAFEPVTGATVNGASMSGPVTSFSFAIVATTALPAPPPSGLDPVFGSAGKVITHFGGKNTAMALQGDGKIVMVGGSILDFLLARYNADGSLDASFGVDGLITTDIDNFTQEEARAVAVQPDGRIVVAGNIRDSRVVGGVLSDKFFFTLVRYNADGSLDTSFNGSGKLRSEVRGRAFAIALQSDGKIVAAGDDASDTPVSSVSNVRVARFNADGSADTSFGGQGVLTTDTTAGDVDGATNIVLQPDGAIVISGEFSKSTGAGVARYLSNGNPDGSFGAAGKVDLSGAFVGEGLALQSDGKLVLVGSKPVGTGTAAEFEVRRLNSDGSVDTTFGVGGTMNTVFGTSRDVAQSVVVQQNGKIVVAGLANGFQFGVARYEADGTPDANFFAGGILKVESFGIEASADTVLLQPDGKILLSGFVRDSGGAAPGYGLVRINP
ncbi:MAG TPA: hypothetical protein VJT80_12330 [Steroidobacteraceae bacterium]|nr:hypothetical protein [Steroidobacteraceae bacterium]